MLSRPAAKMHGVEIKGAFPLIHNLNKNNTQWRFITSASFVNDSYRFDFFKKLLASFFQLVVIKRVFLLP